jgi:hypothetical protein
MAEIRNIRHNSGIIAGGDVSNAGVVNYGTKDAADEDELLEELNDLIVALLRDVRQLPARNRTAVRSEVVQLQEEIEAPARDRKRITAALDTLKSAVTVAAPLAEIVKDITDIVTQIIR